MGAGRILALDLGARRTGLAHSDPTGTLASPLGVVEGDPIPAVLAQLASASYVGLIVGEPRSLHGHATAQTDAVHQTVERLRAATALPITLVDERLTTAQALRARYDAGTSRAHRRTPDDAEAATLLLQTYLDAHR